MQARGLHKHYQMGDEDLHVLRGAAVSVERGAWVAIVGASGSGKSTLLHLLGGLDRPDDGQVLFDGRDIFRAGSIDRYRHTLVGFVFQFYHLLPELTTLENVLIGAMIGRAAWRWPVARSAAGERARDLLSRLGLGQRERHRPAKLSGGERQRVAIARALANDPPLLLADEPTGNLDADNGRRLLDVLGTFHKAGQTIVMVTHDDDVAARADRRLVLADGRLAGAGG